MKIDWTFAPDKIKNIQENDFVLAQENMIFLRMGKGFWPL